MRPCSSTSVTDHRHADRVLPLIALCVGLAAVPAVAQGSACAGPDRPVEIVDVRWGAAAGVETVLLTVEDPNVPTAVSGYNIYRTSDPGTPRDGWPLVAVDAAAQYDSDGRALLADPTGAPAELGPVYYHVTALNGSCGAEGPRGTSNQHDTDGDGVGLRDDPCPTTPFGAEALRTGCAATDYLLQPDLLLGSIPDDGWDWVAASASTEMPTEILFAMESALEQLSEVPAFLHDGAGCSAAASMENSVGSMNELDEQIYQYLSELPGGTTPLGTGRHAHAHGAEGEGGVDGPIEWPSETVLAVQGQYNAFLVLLERANRAWGLANELCAAEGPTGSVEGRVHRVLEERRLVVLTSGEQIVLPWGLGQVDGLQITEDVELQVQGRAVTGLWVASSFDVVPSGVVFTPGPVFTQCLNLRVLPVQPQPAIPGDQLGWIRHEIDGYTDPSGRIEFERGMKLMAEEFNCPGVLPGQGPDGEDLRVEHYYRVRLSYRTNQGNWISNALLASQFRGGQQISLPQQMNGDDGSLEVTRIRRSCVESASIIPIIDPTGGIVGTESIWHCSSEQIMNQTTYPIRSLERGAYCSTTFPTTTFEIEDDDTQSWDSTYVSGVNAQEGAPTPLTFQAIGEKVVNGSLVHDSVIGRFESFAIFGRDVHHHFGAGTDNKSGLDWPHVTGERDGLPFRYTCTVPPIVRDRLGSCDGLPEMFYRLPYPGGTFVQVNQGNGGSFTHNGWQWFALDLSGNSGDPLRAARGGTVVRLRKTMNLNCMTQTCTDWGFPLLDEYGNHVAIQHEDGTVGWYAHMVPNSSPLFLGQKLNRGDYLGQLGNTGNSGGPHLHYHVTPEDPSTWGNTTVLARYEALLFPTLQTQSCLVPPQGSGWVSSNVP